MKATIVGFTGLVLLFCMETPTGAATRAELWKQTAEAVQKGLPRSATNLLVSIQEQALAARAYGEAAKAVAQRIALEANMEGGSPAGKFTRLGAEIGRLPREVRPLLTTLEAHWYWQYFLENKWQFMNRTATDAPPGTNFSTWDLPRLFAEIGRRFDLALAGADALKRTPVGQFGEFLAPGTGSDAVRPTLYDFIAHEALDFYSSGEQAAARPEDDVELAADAPAMGVVPLFGDAEEFVAGKIAKAPSRAVERALVLYRELIAFHLGDKDPTALLDVDLARLRWARDTAAGEGKDGLYQKALERFSRRWAAMPASARALYERAFLEDAAGRKVEARRLALEGMGAHPASIGGRLCQRLAAEIEARSAQISTEHVWNGPWPRIEVRYRNVTRVYFRAVTYDWVVFLDKNRACSESLNAGMRQEILHRSVVKEWSAALPPTLDFKERVEALPAPRELKPGFYFILASHDPAFSDKDNVVSYADVWVSDLALVARTRGSRVDGFVLEAGSGEPVAGAEVMGWSFDQHGERQPQRRTVTDANGWFEVKAGPGRRGVLLRARHQGREIGSRRELWPGPAESGEEAKPQELTLFFTDRALYRPGQMIQYKGISLRVNTAKDNYKVIEDRDVTVMFADANGNEIARARHRTSRYGSFHGSFIAPRDRLAGSMTIHVEKGPEGSTEVQVEEYKRPKFVVSLDAPAAAPKLSETVRVRGLAASYTGAPVDGARARYRITRQPRWPSWWRWWGPRREETQEIAHGTAPTGVDGSFVIEFVARPDLSIPAAQEPAFAFEVHVDVTDSAGETRSADRDVRVGYTAMTAAMEAGEWQTAAKPVGIEIHTATLDDQPQAARGTIRVLALQPPLAVVRGPLAQTEYQPRPELAQPDLSNPENWPEGPQAAERVFETGADGKTRLEAPLGPGFWRVLLESKDVFGKRVTARLTVRVLQPEAVAPGLKIPYLLAAPSWEAQPGQEFFALWGTGYDAGRAFVEIEQRGKMIRRFWTRLGRTQQEIRMAVSEAGRGGFTIHVTQVRENRAYLESRRVEAPWREQKLDLRWEHFTSKLTPGAPETWTLAIKARKGGTNAPEAAVAEVVASLYDASLDAFDPHEWPDWFSLYRKDHSDLMAHFENTTLAFQQMAGEWARTNINILELYRRFPDELVAIRNSWGGPSPIGLARAARRMYSTVMNAARPASEMMVVAEMPPPSKLDDAIAPEPKAAAPKADAPAPAVRKNLRETAFFFPTLLSDSNGVVRIQFTSPEALTKWRFLGFAHDRAMRSGLLEATAVTSKELMVQPNPPRFLREGDAVEFTVKVINTSGAAQRGRVELRFSDAATAAAMDAALGNTPPETAFEIPARESRTYSWRLTIPDGCGFLVWKAVAATDAFSDGEGGALPVLSKRVLVTESLALSIRGPAEKRYDFAKLRQSGGPGGPRHENLVMQITPRPAWCAVMALPYLMEFPHECAEQEFNRLYANALARHIALSDPAVRQVFNQWRNTPALASPLEKNDDLKAVALEETPWLRQARNESQARRNIGVLFDDARLNGETARLLLKVAEAQLPDGAWSWFPGGRADDYMTLYITTGFGRLRHLGVKIDVNPALRALERMDSWMAARHAEILKNPKPEKHVLFPMECLYLYCRSFFLADRPVSPERQAAAAFFLKQGRAFWLETGSRQSQAHLALAFKRWAGPENTAAAAGIMRSLKERALVDPEAGMFWRDAEENYAWHRAPVETQALMIEAFDEVASDARAVQDCQVWLLRQKQTQDWKTTKATADAVYALLLRGSSLLSGPGVVEVQMGGQVVTLPPGGAEAGTGYYERRFAPAEIRPELGLVTVKKTDPGIAWGGVHWQYLEDISKVTAHDKTPLSVRKTFYVKQNTAKGPVLSAVAGPLAVGDELVARIELRADRDMEYVHLKDQRGSGVEPVNVLSGWRWQDGLGYYETTRDTASHFFISWLPRGVYVLEYSMRVQLRGAYTGGMASVECMYAPEFNSHSASPGLLVR